MVPLPEEYPYSSHRAYIGLEPAGIVDVDPVLRHFGNKRETAIKHFLGFMGTAPNDDESDFSSAENDVLGSEEFVDATIHRLGNVEHPLARSRVAKPAFTADKLITAVEAVFGLSSIKFCGPGKDRRVMMAKEVLILTGRDAGASVTELSEIVKLDTSTVSRRYEAAMKKAGNDPQIAFAREQVVKQYYERIAESQD